jgi:SAM-dependent methyltransferase
MITPTDHTVEEFYDTLADSYDEMTGFEKRFASEEPYFRELVRRFSITRAVDAGCGTGFHSLLLARLGVQVTAVDLSEAMLEKLREHVAAEGLSMTTVRASFQKLQHTLKMSFDAVFCMGNALAHLLTAADLHLALDNFSALLNPGGILVIQVLNFERILAQRPRVLNVKTSGNTVFTRSYEYDDPLIRFNIVKSTEGNAQPDDVVTTTLRPVLWKELSVMLGDAGFENARCFGSISMTEYEPATSQDLLVLASGKVKLV